MRAPVGLSNAFEQRLNFLPRPLTSFVGRERETSLIVGLLTAGTTPIVTLTGPGGVGKTRLAIHAAELASASFPDGVAFVALAPIRDPDLVVPTITIAFGARETDGNSPIDTLAAYLRDRRVLLVLDSVEHVLAATRRIATMLAACPGMTALVTGRSPLRITGEQVIPVEPLQLGGHAIVSGDTTETSIDIESEAMQLFVERARSVRPGFRLTAESASAVAEICQRVDGLPLAIELAAARVRHLSPQALRARMGARLPMLIGGARDQPERLQTMTGAIEWSFNLLDLVEQALFRRLAVFVGGFTVEAAAAVCQTSELEVLDGLASLADKSLIRDAMNLSGDTDSGMPRFTMLETIREYALNSLVASGREQETRQRHAEWCIAFAEAGWSAIAPAPVRPLWLDRIEGERDNLRAALSWLDQADDGPNLLRLTGALLPLWIFRSYRGEGRTWLERALAKAPDGPPFDRARALFSQGRLAFLQGDHALADRALTESYELWQRLNDPWGAGWSLLRLGTVALGNGDFDRAYDLVQRALHTLESIENLDGVANCRFELSLVAIGQGHSEESAKLLLDALTLYRENDDAWGAARCLNALAFVDINLGDSASALGWLEQALPIWHELGTKEGMVEWLGAVAAAAASRHQPETALVVFGAVDTASRTLGYPFQLPLRPLVERAQKQARAMLSEVDADRLLAEGAAMPFEQALALATAFLAPTPPDSQPSRSPDTDELTARERDVLRLLVTGQSNPAIAEALYISRGTVKTHVANIFAKLGARSRTEAADLARRRGIL